MPAFVHLGGSKEVNRLIGLAFGFSIAALALPGCAPAQSFSQSAPGTPSAGMTTGALPQGLGGTAPSAAQTATTMEKPPGRLKACTGCHGLRGISPIPDVPHVAGQPLAYQIAAMKAYRTGRRPHLQMGVIAGTMSDSEIEDVSRWYAAIPIQERVAATPEPAAAAPGK